MLSSVRILDFLHHPEVDARIQSSPTFNRFLCVYVFSGQPFVLPSRPVPPLYQPSKMSRDRQTPTRSRLAPSHFILANNPSDPAYPPHSHFGILPYLSRGDNCRV